MADWKKLLKDVLLADGTIDADETAMLRSELLADGVIDEEEMDFLVDLRNSAKDNSKEFDQLFYDSLKQNILADGVIDAQEAARLRELIFADGQVDEDEKALLRALKEGAKETSEEFVNLYNECINQ
jgi:uncharacterized tellurite resistance protein B-like protein